MIFNNILISTCAHPKYISLLINTYKSVSKAVNPLLERSYFMSEIDVKICAEKALALFCEKMLNLPFSENDIVIELLPQKNFFNRLKELSAELSPRSEIPEAHRKRFEDNMSAVAVIGPSKSAVLINQDYCTSENDLMHIVAHELAHIYCAKTEVDGEHFIDIYGNCSLVDAGDDVDSIGYAVWSETIAEYIAITLFRKEVHSLEKALKNIAMLCRELYQYPDSRKYGFARLISYVMAYVKIDELLVELDTPFAMNGSKVEFLEEARYVLKLALTPINERLKSGQPWKITKEFIEDFEVNYLMFVGVNQKFYETNNP